MIVKEYRITMPVSVDEYQIGQLYAVAEASKNETGGGEGVEVLVNEPYEDENGKGQFTHKIYHLKDKVPTVIRVLAPSGALEIHEKAWNAFPYCKTIMTNAYMKDNFTMIVESRHVDNDKGNVENIHNLEGKPLQKRELVKIDIANDPIEAKDYKADEDPQKFKSEKTGRGPLTGEWEKNIGVHMTCYKLVTVEFKWFGLQGTIEALIQNIIRGVFTKFHRQLFCWIDKWYGLTIADIREIEKKTKMELDEKRNKDVDPANQVQTDDKHLRSVTQ